MNKRKKHVFDTGEVPHLWAHRTQEEARNRQGNLYFTGDTIYSYGSHFPIARHVTNDAGERAVLFTTATYSVTTSSHCSAVRSAIPSGMRIFHTPNVCHGRYSGSELTADDHAGNLADYTERIVIPVSVHDQRRSSLPPQLTRNVDYSATRGQRFQPLQWITIASGGFRCLESSSLRSPFSLFRQLFLFSNNPRSLSFPPTFPRMRSCA